MDRVIDDIDAPRQPGRWDFLFSWTGLFFVSWVVYELTSQASLGVTIFCLKFGWEDFRTAFWLRQRDPVPERGKMELWIYVASGLCRTACMAIITMSAVAMIAVITNQPAPQDQLMEAAFTLLVGSTICALTTLRALMLAWWHRRKLWLHSAMHTARADDLWPPIPSHPGSGSLDGKNKAEMVVGFAFVIAVVALLPASILAGTIANNESLFVCPAFILFLASPALFSWLLTYLKRFILAHRPEECWGADALVEESGQIDMLDIGI